MRTDNCPNAKRSGNHPVFAAGSRPLFVAPLWVVLAAGLGCWTEVAFDPSTQAADQAAEVDPSESSGSEAQSQAPAAELAQNDPLEGDRYAIPSGQLGSDGGLTRVEGMAAQAILAPDADENPATTYDPLIGEQSGPQASEPAPPQQVQVAEEAEEGGSQPVRGETPDRMPWEAPNPEPETAADELFSGLVPDASDDDQAPADTEPIEAASAEAQESMPPALDPQPAQPGFLEPNPDKYGGSSEEPLTDPKEPAAQEEQAAQPEDREPQDSEIPDFLSGPAVPSVEPLVEPTAEPPSASAEDPESLLPDFLRSLEKRSDQESAPGPAPAREEPPAAEPLPQPEPPADPPAAPLGEARAVKITLADTRLMAWTLGGKVVLARLPKLTDGDLAESCRADAEALAEALRLPTAAGDKVAVSPARSVEGLNEADLVGLLKAGSSLGDDLAAEHGKEHAALLELAVKSTAAPIISGQRPDLSPVLARAVRLAGQRTKLPVRTWVPLVQALEQRLPADQLRRIAETMYSEVEASLREN